MVDENTNEDKATSDDQSQEPPKTEAASEEKAPAEAASTEAPSGESADGEEKKAEKKRAAPKGPTLPPLPRRGGPREGQSRTPTGPGGRGPGGRGPGGGRGRAGGGGRPGGRGQRHGGEQEESRFDERVIKINRCATVVKGGRRFSFSALVVVGDRKGRIGVGFGKANEVPPSVEKAVKDAQKNFFPVALDRGTIPHKVIGRYRSSKVVMVPAQEGTGVIAGSTVRAVVECAGIRNVLTKSFGSNNPINLAKAASSALREMKTREEIFRLRGINA